MRKSLYTSVVFFDVSHICTFAERCGLQTFVSFQINDHIMLTRFQKIFAVLLLLIPFSGFSQSVVQTVRGEVLDNQTKSPLTGAVVVLTDSIRINSMVDDAGNFRLTGVPIGRHNIKISMLGYRERLIPVVVSAGKEVVLTVEMEQMYIEGEEVVIEADKTKPNNEMTTVSSRPFSIDETQRYAGSLGDPARMAANFAGVQGNNDSRNDIVIRGNSPVGVLWRLNGIDIPNPNHFGSFGSTGGPVSILNNNVLSNSDFMTGAFPAEYGNALAGVFDLRMRNGNNEKHEFMGQLGFNGFEAGAEGPLTRKKRSSYLVNYRYSSLDLFSKMGIDFGTGSAIPKYQDVSFKFNMPTEKRGVFSVFGIGGRSYVEFLDSQRDTTKTYYKTHMGAGGISHAYNFGTSAYGKLTIAASYTDVDARQDSVTYSNGAITPYYGNFFQQLKLNANYMLTKKFSTRNTLKSGVFADRIDYSLEDSVLRYGSIFHKLRDSEGTTWLLRGFSQWQHKFSERLTLNSGVYYQQLTLNNSIAVEPRMGLRWEMTEKQSLSIASGMHSQMQTIFMYFSQTRLPDGSYIQTNRDLDFSKSIHTVIAYDYNFIKDSRLKLELYHQHLYNIPIVKTFPAYSGLNEGADFNNPSIDSLETGGTGRNYGAEITVEKFFSKGYYYLVTASLFDSKYKGYDKVERNTVFNGNYTLNVLAGKEFQLGKKGKNVLAVNLKGTWAGGKRYVPIDFQASAVAGEAVYQYDHAFEKRYSDYFRTDIKVAFTRNGKRITQQWAIDCSNITDHKNVFIETYNPASNSMNTQYQMGLFIIPMYRITF
ncbi:MAG: hypothetical protein FD123_1947 [Bacteroidetes bacterium]|nr:MAG: hypothetical protein FD123_1947 [Bacteroidota bacterium]